MTDAGTKPLTRALLKRPLDWQEVLAALLDIARSALRRFPPYQLDGFQGEHWTDESIEEFLYELFVTRNASGELTNGLIGHVEMLARRLQEGDAVDADAYVATVIRNRAQRLRENARRLHTALYELIRRAFAAMEATPCGGFVKRSKAGGQAPRAIRHRQRSLNRVSQAELTTALYDRVRLPKRRAGRPDAKRAETGLRANEVAAWLCDVLEHTDGWIEAQDLCEVLFGIYGMVEPSEVLQDAPEHFGIENATPDPKLQSRLESLDPEERLIAITADLSVKEAVATLGEQGVEVTASEVKRRRAALQEKVNRKKRWGEGEKN